MVESPSNKKYREFLQLLISGDREKCSRFAEDYFRNNIISIRDFYEKFLKRALYDIGILWEENKISVATEHLASAIVETILNEFYYKYNFAPKSDKKIVLSCVENEFHQIGIKMVSDIFEMNGWQSYFLGANTPINELILFIKRVKPDLLAISLSLYFNTPALEKMIIKIQKSFPNLPILVGGQAFQHGGSDIIKKYENISFFKDLKSIDTYIKNLKKNEQRELN